MKQIGKYKGLLDMINGGGADAEGDKFEGGGLLSAIANALATPYGSEDRMRDAMRAQRPMARPTGGFGNSSANSAPPKTVSQMPLTSASDISGGFNLANTAPVQPSATGVTYAPSVLPDFTMPDGSSIDRAAPMQGPSTSGMNPSNVYVDPRQRFAKELVELIGPDAAQSYLGTGAGEQLYANYVKNGYKFPNY